MNVRERGRHTDMEGEESPGREDNKLRKEELEKGRIRIKWVERKKQEDECGTWEPLRTILSSQP